MAKLAQPPDPTPQRPADGGGAPVTLHTATAAHAEVLPLHQPNAMFALAFDPLAWEVRGGRVVPRPLRIDLDAGVNNVAGVQGGGINPSGMYAEQQSRGRVVIAPDATKPHADYLRKHRLAQGWHHCERWAQPIPGTDAYTRDEVGYAAWLASLVDGGHVPPPSPAVLGLLLERLRATRDAYAASRHRPTTDAIGEIERQIAVVEAAITSAAPTSAGEGVTL